MKINVTHSILNLKNEPIQSIHSTGELETDFDGNPVYITYRGVMANALNNPAKGETLTSEQKDKSYKLMIKLYASDEVELSLDEASYIKERVNKVYNNSLICGRVGEILEIKTDA